MRGDLVGYPDEGAALHYPHQEKEAQDRQRCPAKAQPEECKGQRRPLLPIHEHKENAHNELIDENPPCQQGWADCPRSNVRHGWRGRGRRVVDLDIAERVQVSLDEWLSPKREPVLEEVIPPPGEWPHCHPEDEKPKRPREVV